LAGIESVLNNVDKQQFAASINQGLKRALVETNRNDHEKPRVINRFFNLEECAKRIYVQSAGTIFHLNLCATKEDWYEEMVDFIEYNGITFGLPSTGYRQYLEALQHLIRDQDPNPKLAKLSEYIRIELSNDEKKSDKKELQAQVEMFDEWWKSIPFDLEYLKRIENDKNELMALLFAIGPKGSPQISRYSYVLKTSVYSTTELSEALCRLTTVIIQNLNVLTHYENDQLTDPQKVKLQILLAHRRKQLEVDYLVDDENQTPKYQQIWRKWLEDEMSFFSELEPLLSGVPPNFNPKTNQIIEELNRFDFKNFLKKEGYNLPAIYNLIELQGGGVPYCITLLHELGYLKYFLFEFCKSKNDCNQKLAKIFDASERRIKGNINIISNSNSEEDPIQYTSRNYQETVRKQLKGLK
jgi:hypothetical protein